MILYLIIFHHSEDTWDKWIREEHILTRGFKGVNSQALGSIWWCRKLGREYGVPWSLPILFLCRSKVLFTITKWCCSLLFLHPLFCVLYDRLVKLSTKVLVVLLSLPLSVSFHFGISLVMLSLCWILSSCLRLAISFHPFLWSMFTSSLCCLNILMNILSNFLSQTFSKSFPLGATIGYLWSSFLCFSSFFSHVVCFCTENCESEVVCWSFFLDSPTLLFLWFKFLFLIALTMFSQAPSHS